MAEGRVSDGFDNSNEPYGDLNQIRFPCGEEDEFLVPADMTDAERVHDPIAWKMWRETMLSVGKSEISLAGKTFAKLQFQAARIKLGAIFESLEDFQFALDCWSLQHSRINKHFKTRGNYYVRTCIYGFPMRQDPATRKRNREAVNGESGKENAQPNQESQNSVQSTQPQPSQCALAGAADLNQVPGGEDREQEVQVGVRPRKARRIPESGACGQYVRYLSAGPFPDNGLEKSPDQAGSSKEKGSQEAEGTTSKRCEWRVRCQRQLKSGSFQITVCNLQHTCPGHLHTWRGPCHNSKHLATLMCNSVGLDTNGALRGQVNDLRQTFEKCTFQGDQTRSFHAIPALCRRIRDVDPDSVVEYSTWPGSSIFKQVFVCPSACRHALQYSQKVVTLDACHTRNKNYPAHIFTSSCSDGNNQSIVLCFAVVASEDEETWSWFCELMRRSIIGIDQKCNVILSDRCKGLLNAVKRIFPDHVHGQCAQHLRMDVKHRFGKEAETIFSSLVYARKESKFNLILDNLQSSGRSGAEAAEYIRKIPACLWARSQFPLPRYGKVASNIAESVNLALKPIREYAPFRVVWELWTYLMVRFAKRRVDARMYGVLTPFAQFRYDKNEKASGQFICHVSSEDTALVQKTGLGGEYVVKHGNKPSCDCSEFQEMLWPCAHSMNWDREFSRDPMRNMDSVWLSRTLMRIYSRSIPPVVNTELMLEFNCAPPPVAIQKGRHRVVRIPRGGTLRGNETEIDGREIEAELEYPIDEEAEHLSHMSQSTSQPAQGGANGESSQTLTARIKRQRLKFLVNSNQRQRRCSTCKSLGHNVRTCPQRDVLNTVHNTESVSEALTGVETTMPPAFQNHRDQDGEILDLEPESENEGECIYDMDHIGFSSIDELEHGRRKASLADASHK